MHSPALPAMLGVSRELAELERLLADQSEQIRRLRAELKVAQRARDRYKRIIVAAGIRAYSQKWGGVSRPKKHTPA